MENKSPRIVGVAIPKPLETIFDYQVPAGMAIPSLGCRLRVPFGKGESIGICVETKRESGAKKLREIIEVVDDDSLISADLLGVALWMAKYYHHPIQPASGWIGLVVILFPGSKCWAPWDPCASQKV